MESFIVLCNKKNLPNVNTKKNKCFFCLFLHCLKSKSFFNKQRKSQVFFLFDHKNHSKPRKHNLRSWNQNLQHVLFFWYLVFSRLACPTLSLQLPIRFPIPLPMQVQGHSTRKGRFLLKEFFQCYQEDEEESYKGFEKERRVTRDV